MRSKIRWFTEFCNSHYVSHFAAFFIDTGAKISVVESCLWFRGHNTRLRLLIASGLIEVWGGLGWIQITDVPTDGPGGKTTGTPPERRPPDLERAAKSPNQGTDARQPASRQCARGTFGYQSGFDRFNDPSAGSPTETLLRLLLPLGGRV